MPKVVVIHQPDFLPYLGFFHRLMEADEWIALDHVQFSRGGSDCWTHRDKIKTPQGERWLTLGLEKAPLGTRINRVELSGDERWRERCLAQIRENYRKAPFFRTIFPVVEEIFGYRESRLMAEFNLHTLKKLASLLDLRTPMRLASDLSPLGVSNELLVDLLLKTGAEVYLSGSGARAYLDESLFTSAGVLVVWQKFEHPVYPQINGPFIPYLSVLDALMNIGPGDVRALLETLPRAAGGTNPKDQTWTPTQHRSTCDKR